MKKRLCLLSLKLEQPNERHAAEKHSLLLNTAAFKKEEQFKKNLPFIFLNLGHIQPHNDPRMP